VRANFGVPVDDRPPDFLTVEEAGAVLRLSRGKAYELARLYLATGGLSGMPVIRLGRQLRVPRALFEQWLGGPITWPIPTQTRASAAIASPIVCPVASITPSSTGKRSTRRAARSPDQDARLFPA
jgi:excisionase family DNA binding protein